MLKRFCTLLITIVMTTCMLLSVSYADDTCSITVAPNVTALEITKGGREQVNLSGIFSDSRGHELTYTLDSSDESLKARISDGVLLIDPLELGEYSVQITATCGVSGEEKQITIPVNIVESEDEGNPAQYGYDETPAESATAFFTFSCDGVPLMGNDAEHTILAHLKVKVPYFDLGLYGLEKYYRYHTRNGKGVYIDDEIVERPTAMHLFIYVTERYYMGIPEEECCKGTSGLLTFNQPVTMLNMYGEKAYDCKYRAYCVSGSPTSSFMNELWGHDQNLMYYRNHFFPLMSPGWGSTADYQLISDGDTFDVGMYSDWSFYQGGAFCCFDKEEYETPAGETLLFSTLKTSSSEFGSGELKPISGLKTEIYDEEWNKIDTVQSETAGFGYAFQIPGRYHIVGMDENAGTAHANKSPATADVIVRDPFTEYSFSKVTDQDGKLVPRIEESEDIADMKCYHISVPDGTTAVNIEWPDLDDGDISLDYYDYAEKKLVETEDKAERTGNTVTLDPAVWSKDSRAAVLTDSHGNVLGCFSFSYFTAEVINFAPCLKSGIRSPYKLSWREKKDYAVKLSDIFIDYDGDEMTYSVSIDGAPVVSIEDGYKYSSDVLGKHTLEFYATDSKGKTGESYIIDMTITANQRPVFKEQSDTGRTLSIRYYETAKLNLLDVFSDFDNDHLTYSVSKDGDDYQEIDPEEITEYGKSITATTREHWQARYLEFSPSGRDELGEHTFRIKALDGLSESMDIYELKVNVEENKAPVPEREEHDEYCMAGHYWTFDPKEYFKDPEGDKILSYKVSVNGSDPVICDRFKHLDKWNCHRILIEPEVEKYVVRFYAEDIYGSVGTCTVNVYTRPEQIDELEVKENSFDADKDGVVEYTSGKDEPATQITGFKVSKNVTLRNVSCSEENGDLTYYLDIDDLGIDENETFTITMGHEQSKEGLYVGPVLGTDNNNAVELRTVSSDTTSSLSWYGDFYEENGSTYRREQSVQFYRIVVNMVDAGDPDPEELILEPMSDELYVGDLTDRCIVKARYSDDIVRYVKEYTLSDTSFDSPGTKVLRASAFGLTAEAKINVKKVPQNMIILNDLGKYGRVRLAEVLDEDGKSYEGALISTSDPIVDPGYDDSRYDGSVMGKIPDMLRKTYDIDVRAPMDYDKEHIKIRFEMQKDIDYSTELIMGEMGTTAWGSPYHAVGENVENLQSGDTTNGYLTIKYTKGQSQHKAMWFDRKSGGMSWWHSYDLFNISVKAGAAEVTGKVSSWDEIKNCEILAYPESMTDEEIGSDARGEKNKVITTSTTFEDPVKNGNRYEQSFKLEGLDAGTYKLAVVKPGKYVVKVVKADIDGTDDVGTLELRLFGDVTNDGKVKAGDATQIARYVVGSRKFNDEELLSADVTLDGNVKIGDATQVVRYVVGKGSSLDDIN